MHSYNCTPKSFIEPTVRFLCLICLLDRSIQNAIYSFVYTLSNFYGSFHSFKHSGYILWMIPSSACIQSCWFLGMRWVNSFIQTFGRSFLEIPSNDLNGRSFYDTFLLIPLDNFRWIQFAFNDTFELISDDDSQFIHSCNYSDDFELQLSPISSIRAQSREILLINEFAGRCCRGNRHRFSTP